MALEYRSLLDLIYPIGSIYVNADPDYEINPTEYFGGQWVEISQDCTLRTASTTHAKNTIAGTNKLTIEETHMPSHTHTINSHGHEFSITISDNNHSHGFSAVEKDSNGNTVQTATILQMISGAFKRLTVGKGESDRWCLTAPTQHNLYWTSTTTSHTHTHTLTPILKGSGMLTSNARGEGNSQDYPTQSYYCKMWRRTA